MLTSADPSCPWKYIEPDLVITGPLGSLASVAKVKKWLSRCLSKHSRCEQASSTQLPTRVIKIEGPADVELYTTKDEVATYACLSHCWGRNPIRFTTTENFKQYSTSIPCEDLPAAFQHAIEFAYYLEIRYLWIDSLCIVQDSIDDWRHEGSKMSKIYENAAITLSATGFVDSHQGCFPGTDERFISRQKTFMNHDDEEYEIHCRESLPQWKAPLYARGWVFQERMLSRRIVHFMDEEIWWECRESFHCECGSLEHNGNVFGLNKNSAAEMSEFSSLGMIETRWKELVTTYSSKSLTYLSDVFPAIQALAKLVPSKMGRYLAGHWESTLISSLGWCAFMPVPVRKEHREWHAPSWSWAAIQGKVY
ncbi:heterokaryon incompatibility protein-domain-containing protein [Alternaria rosae]|uniref:heterokaryon incompatibility protein-domain-containing protein n=1 Tax=Alternaria rosae TaxID=1187941 RepID=UPI001E8DC23C|nr:heterokaryon incompatibility protein-domain-containing protein [Alternaria rosae]KAH6859002.1 heterokaryon incompatibility protein-domain-containing protein [Alternaria rosae]